MKRLISTMLLMTLASVVAFAQQTATPKPASQAKVLTRAEFDKLVTNPSGVLIIDVRRPDEITSNGGFPVYLSIQIGDLEKSLAWIPKDRRIVTVSNHAGRAGQAADLLAKKGFNVAGAIGAQVYEKDGGQLAKITPPPAKPAAATAAANK